MRLNPIIFNDPESFGIAFNYFEGGALYQLICSDCLATSENSADGQTVYPKVFNINFHKINGNFTQHQPDNIKDLFDLTSSISMKCVKVLRDRIADLEKKLW